MTSEQTTYPRPSDETHPSWKWIIGVLLAIAGFFIVGTFSKVDKMSTALESLTTNLAVQQRDISTLTTAYNEQKEELKDLRNRVQNLEHAQLASK
ncbi:MAG: hypothetical protein EOO11_19440 [Chitinophagaceae bacterium]|nr:MAG: hypothetical protein EOO11_19440 [Chitinophagaceae bacterium]